MARLSLSLLGSFHATLDGQPITAFESNKVRALLAYLAVEADWPHPRESLAGLLRSDYPERSALSNLREAIGGRQAELPFLLITRETFQFNTESDHDLDVATFTQHIADSGPASQRIGESAVSRLQSAISRYRGSFLEGFSCDGAPFEEWILVRREQTNRQMLNALHRLAAHCEGCGEYEHAVTHVRKQLELEP